LARRFRARWQPSDLPRVAQVIPAAKAAGIVSGSSPSQVVHRVVGRVYRVQGKYFNGEPTVRMNCDIGRVLSAMIRWK
jgi:hypothetical protein